MPALHFIIDQTPFPSLRPRFRRAGHLTYAYSDPRHAAYLAVVQQQAAKAMADADLSMVPEGCAVHLETTFTFAFPKSWSKKRKMGLASGLHTQKPDKDNLNKMIMDGMTGIVYADDCQVASGQQHKGWAERIEWPAYTIVDVYW